MIQPGQYYAILAEGRIRNVSVGVSVPFLAEHMLAAGCQQALNMDGGQTAVMTFMGNQISRIGKYSGGKTNQTEMIAILISEGKTLEEGISHMFEKIKGSCSLLILHEDGTVYAVRDKLGRTPIIIGKKDGAMAVTSESNAFHNLGYDIDYFIKPGEMVKLTPDGWTQLRPGGDKMQICSFFWVYFGFPSCDYEGINVDQVRCSLGEELGKKDDVEADFVCGIPDSGIGHAIGYAIGHKIPYRFFSFDAYLNYGAVFKQIIGLHCMDGG
jgi:glutamine phosphoribosylpyrophosphate amidotransferase